MSNVETIHAYRRARETARKLRRAAINAEPGTVQREAFTNAANTVTARASEYAWQIQHNNR